MKTVLCVMSLFLFGFYSERKPMNVVNEIEVQPSITIHIEGAVSKEGDYTFNEVLSVEEALNEVGLKENANTDVVALNQEIIPEMLIYVPTKKENLISLNTGTIEELQTIKGIGPKKAQAIIEGRPYTCLEDLMNVKGIGETTYRKWRDYFSL